MAISIQYLKEKLACLYRHHPLINNAKSLSQALDISPANITQWINGSPGSKAPETVPDKQLQKIQALSGVSEQIWMTSNVDEFKQALIHTPQNHTQPAMPIRKTSVCMLPLYLHEHHKAELHPDITAVLVTISEDVISFISQSRQLLVIPLGSAFGFRRTCQSHLQLAAEYNLKYIIDPAVSFSETRVSINISIIDGENGQLVFSKRVTESSDKLDQLDKTISAVIAGHIEPSLLNLCGSSVQKKEDSHLDYWQKLAKARWLFWRTSQNDCHQAKEVLHHLVEEKPDDAQVLSLLSFCFMLDVWSGWSSDPDMAWRQSKFYSAQAIKADNTHPYAHFTYGTNISCGQKDFDVALESQHYAIDLNPSFAAAYGEIARIYAFLGDVSNTEYYHKKACSISPLDPHLPLWHRSMSLAYLVAKQYESALEWARKASSIRPEWWLSNHLYAVCLVKTNDVQKAKAVLRQSDTFQTRIKRYDDHYPLKILHYSHPFNHQEDFNTFLQCLDQADWLV